MGAPAKAGRRPTVLATLQKFHAEMFSILGTEPIDRKDFDKAMITSLGVGYPQVYNLLKTGEAVGLWRQGQGLRDRVKTVELLAPTTSPTAPPSLQEAPEQPG